MGYFSYVEKQVAYSQHQFDRPQKGCMLSAALGFPKNISHHSFLALHSLEKGRKYEVKITCITYKFIIYQSHEKSLEEREDETKNIQEIVFWTYLLIMMAAISQNLVDQT